MIRRLVVLVAMVLVFANSPLLEAQRSRSKGSTGSATSEKTVHVKEYIRKDGTIVKAHDREPD
jgi:hypothetical protein